MKSDAAGEGYPLNPCRRAAVFQPGLRQEEPAAFAPRSFARSVWMESISREIGKALAEQLPALTPNAAAVEADRCLYCYDAPCTHACPTHIDIPRFIKKIASNNLRGSAEAIYASNLLAQPSRAVAPGRG